MFKSRKKEIDYLKQCIDTLYDHLIKTNNQVLKLLDTINDQQKMINDLQKRQNELVCLLNGKIEES